MPAGRSIFRSAITGADGEVDAGYLALFMLMFVVTGAIPIMAIVGGISAMWQPEQAAAILQGVGVGIGSVCGGFGVALGALGAFRAGDKPHGGTTTTTVQSATMTEVTPAAAPKAKGA